MNVLVINCGSSSIKYKLLNVATKDLLLKGVIEDIRTPADYDTAISNLLKQAEQHSINAVGHRVVHGGDTFSDATLIDDDVIEQIEAWVPMAPLHNPNSLEGIKAAKKALPDIPQVAVFDTAFHARMPRRAQSYAINQSLASKHRIRRYGFHGTSHHYVALQAAEFLGRPLNELRIVSLHLGNGASACAIEYGQSTDTSMGMTPLEGLVMGTRAGDIDAGVLVHLLRHEVDSVDELDQLLNRESGLKGLSGVSNDLREIENQAAQGNDGARQAIAVFAQRAKKYIGAYATVMGGLDAVVLTGGIGENSETIRHRILQRLDFLGLKLDEDRNQDANVSADNPVERISRDISNVQALVIKTNEELMIAQQSAEIIKQANFQDYSLEIPIAVSARHLHLDKETFAILFGEDAEPTHLADLHQPGQYACNETVNLIGPRSKIEGVRLLGPLRSKNQVEISRTDEFSLGVDAPVRNSGHTDDSAPIILEGPKGKVELHEGLICARRHIHMHTDDAERFGLKNKDVVEIAVTGGPRDLIFCDVLVRVSPKYKLEMHIDTDEANAAEFSKQSSGQLVYSDVEGASAKLMAKKSL